MKIFYSLPLAPVLHISLLVPGGKKNMPGHLTQTQALTYVYVYHISDPDGG